MSFLKIGTVILGLSTLAVGTMFIIPSVPAWSPLISEDNFSSEYESTKFGNKYKNFLVGTYGSSGWWEWSYENWKADVLKEETKSLLSEQFKEPTKIGGAFSAKNATSSSPTSLNKVCEEAYKKSITDVEPSGQDETKKKYEANIWKYCSPLGGKPITLEGDGYSSGTIGDDKKANLVSVKDYRNHLFWRIKNEEFNGSDKSLTEGEANKYFKKQKELGNHLMDICEKSYSMSKSTTSSETNPSEQETLKFCSLEGK